jgi:NAD(P)-dependent dehydrogenase (short-subunit alcohol dehydrogenase family)
VIFSWNSDQEAAEQLASELPGSLPVRMDLADVNDIKDKITQLYREVDTLHALVNNAAIAQVMPLPLVEEQDVDRVMDINIKGTLFVTQQVIKGMVRNKSGVVVNVGSIGGNRMFDVPVTYAMSKAAINGMTYALAVELKRFGIRVNSVVPGLIDGGVGEGVPEELRADFINHCATGRSGTAAEVAELICFLASDRAGYINGQNISIDGGI